MTGDQAMDWLNWCKNNDYLNAPLKWDVQAAADTAINALKALEEIKAEILTEHAKMYKRRDSDEWEQGEQYCHAACAGQRHVDAQ